MDDDAVKQNKVGLFAWIGLPASTEVDAWAHGLGYELEPEQLLTSGRSGSIVGFVTARGFDGGDRRLLFKFNAEDANPDEGAIHAAALESSDAFARDHLVPLLAPALMLSSGASATLQIIAGGDTGSWKALSSLSGTGDIGRSLAFIGTSMLDEWNETARIASRSVSDFVGPRVMRRLEEAGALRTWIAEQFSEEILESDWLVFSSQQGSPRRVNPIVLILSSGEVSESPQFLALVGNSHGDLHLDNVLLPIGGLPDPKSYRLIDLATYSSERSLTDDPANLLLSEVERLVDAFSVDLRLGFLSWIDFREQTPLRTELGLITSAWAAMESSGMGFGSRRGYGKEWRAQFWLSICASALVLASRERLKEHSRVWFFELSAIAATKWSEIMETFPTGSSWALVGPEVDARTKTASSSANAIAALCADFDSSVITVAIVPRGGLDPWSMVSLAGNGWDLIVEFDELTNEPDGNFSLAKRSGEAVRLVSPVSQKATFTRLSTTWLAGAGLASVGSTEAKPRDLRHWRADYLNGVREAFRTLSIAYSGPVKVVIFGQPDDFVRAVTEVALDETGLRASLHLVMTTNSDSLSGYDPVFEMAEPNLVVRALPHRVVTSDEDGASATLPAGSPGGRVILADHDRAWIEEGYELLHSLVAIQSNSIDGVGLDFYSGRRISWFELATGADLRRDSAIPALTRALALKLERRSSDRHPYHHYPGAGGTTIARRLAWNFHDQYPTLVAGRVTDANHIADRIERLAVLTDRKVLVVLENTSEPVSNALFERLRSNSVPVLLLMISRQGGSDLKSEPTRQLGAMNAEEMSEFRRFFAAMRPERRVQLDRIGTPNNEAAVPFMYALSAFHKDFVGLKQYVRGFTDELDTDLRAVVIVIALAHLFAGTSIHSSVFAQHLRIPPTAPARLAARFGDKVHGLLLEERPGYWRTTHSLVAKQILLELLTPKEGSGTADPESWRFALPDWAETLIGFVSDAATGELPIDSDELLQQLFIKREVRHDGDKTKYSELIATIPSEARERVFQRLTAEFPEEAHFWAHYSRWQSFEARDHFAARQSMDKALQRDNSDPTLWHMRGTNVRRELYGFLDAHRFQATTPEDRADAQTVVERLAKEAIGDYNEARRIDDRSEYPLISTAELCLRVIEWGKTVYTASSYTQFLNRPSSQFFAELLDIAEDSADAIIELEGDDKESRAVAQVRSRLKGIYDDYNGMIQGWRNILDKSSGSKTAIRVRLAHLYGLRNGGWDTATKADISAAMTLLNESLLDNPTDPRTVRAWLSAGRHSGVSLNRAAEVVSHWVEYINSRDALYYDYVLSALSALNGALSSSEDLSRKVTLMRSRSQDFEQKRTIFDWVGKHEGLGQLINKAQVIEWDRSIAGSDPSALRRLQGRVNTISNPKSGTILLANDVEVFFTPSAAGMLAGQDNNVAVTALVGFSYDGLIAWGVERKA